MIYLYVNKERFMKRSSSKGEVRPEDEIREAEVEGPSDDHETASNASPEGAISSSASSADTPKASSLEQALRRGIVVRKPKPKKPTT
jgi:hypothetical protein